MADADAPFKTSMLSMSSGLISAMRFTPRSWIARCDTDRQRA